MIGVVGLGMGVIIPKWFVAKRGRALALSGMGAKLGNAITPLYIQYLVALNSWRLAALISGVVVWVVSLVPIVLFLRRNPEDMGLLPDGASHYVSDAVNQEGGSGTVKETSLSLRSVLNYPAFYLLTASVALTSFAQPSLNLHTIPFFTD